VAIIPGLIKAGRHWRPARARCGTLARAGRFVEQSGLHVDDRRSIGSVGVQSSTVVLVF